MFIFSFSSYTIYKCIYSRTNNTQQHEDGYLPDECMMILFYYFRI